MQVGAFQRRSTPYTSDTEVTARIGVEGLETKHRELIKRRARMSIITFVFSVYVVAGSAKHRGQSVAIPSQKSARNMVDKFASIRSGCYISVSQLKAILPLHKLLVHRSNLFYRADIPDVIRYLAVDLAIRREEAVRHFLAHNDKQIDAALEKILQSTNDVVLAALISYPMSFTDETLFKPIAGVLDEYMVIRRQRCMQDLLPEIFQDLAVYRQYFTPLPGYRVIPNYDRGYDAIVPVDLKPHDILRGGSRMYSSRDIPVIAVDRGERRGKDMLVDVRRNRIVTVNLPFRFIEFSGKKQLLVLYNEHTHDFLFWRSDSGEPLMLPCEGRTKLYTFMNNTVVSFPIASYIIPMDLSKSFVVTRVDGRLDASLMTERAGRIHHFTDAGVGVSLSESSLVILADESNALATMIAEGAGSSIEELVRSLEPEADKLGLVYALINAMMTVTDAIEVWLLYQQLSLMFGLNTREELVDFVVKAVDGYRPEGIEVIPSLASSIEGADPFPRVRSYPSIMKERAIRFLYRQLVATLADNRVRAGIVCIALALSASYMRYAVEGASGFRA